jgi:serine/threonine-protein kinase
MLKVTDAVHFAHQHGLLHRDLKPSNILLDGTGDPKLVDFGLARRLGQSYGSVTSRVIEGALDYMGPEQARGGLEGLTVVADVYSLGATLYELLTGTVPFQAANEFELLELIKSDIPVTPPRELVPSVHPFLEAVCLRCLEKQPQRRYQSAEALANDLRRVANGDTPEVSALSAWKRLGHWVRRHPASAKRALGIGLLVCLAVGMSVSHWQDRSRRERDALRSNAAIASGQAGAILFQLSSYAARLEQAAKLADVPRYASRELYDEDPTPAFKAAAEGFDSLFVVAVDGLLRAQWPPSEKWIWRRNYEFRDYFIGARALGERGSSEVHIAKAFRAERDGEVKFGISTPVYDGSRWIGVLVALISTGCISYKTCNIPCSAVTG